MRNYIKSRLHRRFSIIFLLVLVLAAAGGIGQHIYMSANQQGLQNESRQWRETQNVLADLEFYTQQIIIAGRGYLAFGDGSELDDTERNLSAARAQLEEYRSLGKADTDLVAQTEEFLNDYKNEWLPQLTEAVEAGSTTIENREQISSQAGALINSLSSGHDQAEAARMNVNDRYFELNENSNLAYLLYLIGMLSALGVIVWLLLRKTTGPLWEMKNAAAKVGSGEEIAISDNHRSDEIGELSRSFNAMASSIQQNQNAIMDRNEELVVQQNELQEQQEYLRTLNELNETFSGSMGKQVLMEQLLAKMYDLFHFDKGMVAALEPSWQAAWYGMSEEEKQHFETHSADSPFALIENTKKAHVIERKSYGGEEGLSTKETTVYEMYLPVFSSKQEMIGAAVFTRTGKNFSGRERETMQGILRQASISFGRILLFEKTEKERFLYQRIIDSVDEGIQYIDESGTLEHANHWTWSMIGAGAQNEAQALPFGEWTSEWLKQIDEDCREKVENYFQAFIDNGTGPDFSIEYKITTDSSVHVYELYGRNVQMESEEKGTIFVHRNRTKEFELDQMKSDLVSTVSHELRTPLSSILGFAELLLVKDLKPARQKKYIETIHREGGRLTSLINDFLDLQRMEAGRQEYEMEEVDLSSLMLEVVDTFEPNQPEHTFVVKDRLQYGRIHADKGKIVQGVTNIIGNAVKFSPEGGEVKIELANEQNMVRVKISDEGLGIPEKELPHLFSKFHRINDEDRRKIRGTGLGLAVTKQIVEDHKGRIEVASTEGEGSSFCLFFPLAGVEFDMEELPEGSELHSVLILEDDRSLGMLLSEELRHARYEVVHYFNPYKALEALKRGLRPEVFVVDLMLGEEMDGWKFIERLKSFRHTEDVPIIVSSALHEDKERMARMDVRHYLTKPYPPNSLSQQVRRIIEQTDNHGEVYVPDFNEV
ncbi:ATP-binding protein [Marinococcus halophilus]|uniref:ATP-binding protein n=1 Tax=Marinococcus halophilus TaxID=1371 RepID=UPI0009A8ED67|nr:ATP-binding protein [Marinococcus halophilus]